MGFFKNIKAKLEDLPIRGRMESNLFITKIFNSQKRTKFGLKYINKMNTAVSTKTQFPMTVFFKNILSKVSQTQFDSLKWSQRRL